MSIVLLSTGGTIASLSDTDKKLDAEDLLETLPSSSPNVSVKTQNFGNIPSTKMSIKNMYHLTNSINQLDADPSVDGIVVTHGTDVLEESAYFVDLCYNGDTPVVFTGAMRSPSMPGSDGPANILDSIYVALDQQASGIGILVVFGDQVYDACGTVKTHATVPASFGSPEFGPLATVDHDRVIWSRIPAKTTPTYTLNPEQLTGDVLAVPVTADTSGDAIRAGIGSKAVCVGVPGAGNLPPTGRDALVDLRDANVPTVVTSRCPQGRLSTSAKDLSGLDVYVSNRNLLQTRIKTIVALSADRMSSAFTLIN